MNKKKPGWREFEEMIADLERYISNDQVAVKSPDMIPELITGRLRQVDASIRTTAGSTDVLITIECRKRKDRNDVTWIEQLITKRELIGASQTIAVSSSGFTDGARQLAHNRGIVLRQVNDVTEEVKKWVRKPKCYVPRYKYQVHRLILIDSAQRSLQLSGNQLGFPIIKNKTQQRIPAKGIVEEILFGYGVITQFGDTNDPVGRIIKGKTIPGYNSILLNGVSAELKEFLIDITVQRYWEETADNTELISSMAYCAEDRQLARLETMRFNLPYPLEGDCMEISYFANPVTEISNQESLATAAQSVAF